MKYATETITREISELVTAAKMRAIFDRLKSAVDDKEGADPIENLFGEVSELDKYLCIKFKKAVEKFEVLPGDLTPGGASPAAVLEPMAIPHPDELRSNTTIKFKIVGDKQAGSKSKARFEMYRSATTPASPPPVGP